MRFLTHRPGPPLADFVDWFWFYEGLNPAHRLERVLPEGTFELVINLRDEPRHVFERDDLEPAAAFRRGWISGAQAQFIVIDTAPDSSMIGVHFRPGGAAAFLGLPADELQDQVVELDAVWGLAGWKLREALLEAATPEEKFRLLEAFLRSRARGQFQRDRAIGHALRVLMQPPGAPRLDALASELGWSHKHLIERFRTEVGLTPKRFLRIRRFQQVLRAVEARRAVEWADLAVACGYYDQAHFTHDFRAFSGLNPTIYLTARGEYLNFVPIAGGG